MTKPNNLLGRTFGYLEVLERANAQYAEDIIVFSNINFEHCTIAQNLCEGIKISN